MNDDDDSMLPKLLLFGGIALTLMLLTLDSKASEVKISYDPLQVTVVQHKDGSIEISSNDSRTHYEYN